MSPRVRRPIAGARGEGLRMVLTLVLAGAVLAAAAARALADPARYTLAGHNVTVYNLVGSLEILPGTGSSVVAEVDLQGADASRLTVEKGTVRGREALRVIYPGDRVVVPSMGSNSTSTMRVNEDGTFGDDRDGHEQGRKVTLSGRGPGVEASADVKLLVPPGTSLIVRWGHGEASVSRVDADLTLDGASMPIRAEQLRGAFHADIGSGGVDVLGCEGSVGVDTGSGRVHLRDVRTRGDIVVDTGSGEVSGESLTAASVAIDTGSGAIALESVQAKSVTLDTGSGSIDLDLGEDVSMLVVESGSGDVTVSFPRGVGAQLSVETGSGGIHSDLALEAQVRKHDALVGRIGDGHGTIEIETGSGTVTLRERKL